MSDIKEKNNEKIITRYLTLFGLNIDYTEKELQSAYRTLAKLNHPDMTKDSTSEMRMVIINEAYDTLKTISQTTKEEIKLNELHAESDDSYVLYKKAFKIMKAAFEEYYGENINKDDQNNLKLLRERLQTAKDEFAKIVNNSNYSQWIDDSIDKICSINKWL